MKKVSSDELRLLLRIAEHFSLSHTLSEALVSPPPRSRRSPRN